MDDFDRFSAYCGLFLSLTKLLSYCDMLRDLDDFYILAAVVDLESNHPELLPTVSNILKFVSMPRKTLEVRLKYLIERDLVIPTETTGGRTPRLYYGNRECIAKCLTTDRGKDVQDHYQQSLVVAIDRLTQR